MAPPLAKVVAGETSLLIFIFWSAKWELQLSNFTRQKCQKCDDSANTWKDLKEWKRSRPALGKLDCTLYNHHGTIFNWPSQNAQKHEWPSILKYFQKHMSHTDQKILWHIYAMIWGWITWESSSCSWLSIVGNFNGIFRPGTSLKALSSFSQGDNAVSTNETEIHYFIFHSRHKLTLSLTKYRVPSLHKLYNYVSQSLY